MTTFSDFEIIEWLVQNGAQLWPTRKGYGTKGKGPITSWTCQVFVTVKGERRCIQPTRPIMREAIWAAMTHFYEAMK